MITKYNINEKVYLIFDNEIKILKIKRILISEQSLIQYNMIFDNKDVYRLEKDVFKTKEDLIKNL
jgi:hypothetical protein